MDTGNPTNPTTVLPQSGIHDAVIPIPSGTASGQSDQSIPSGTVALGGAAGIGSKELEPGAGGLEQATLKDVSGKEIELPKEVAAAGVKTQPTTVTIPRAVSQMGVTPVGQAVPAQATTVALPLTDDQIARGLTQSITSSWRWLSEWCIRKLKQLHSKLRTQ